MERRNLRDRSESIGCTLSAAGAAAIRMEIKLDAKLADGIAESAISYLHATQGNKILCTRDVAKRVILAAIEEAHEIGFLAGQEDQFAELFKPGSPDRPAWMDIRLDAEELARHHLRFNPIVLRSLAGAGYRCVGDLRWVPNRKLTELHYIGRKTARKLVAVVRRFELTV